MKLARSGALLLVLALAGLVRADTSLALGQAPNTWVKRSPLKGGAPSPGMGYETSLGSVTD